MQRPPWLHWQKLRLSLWLTVALLLVGLPSLIVLFVMPLVQALPRLQEGSPDEALRLAHEMVSAASPAWLNVYALLTQAGLVWFTYFSGSRRVKDGDKFVVFLVMCIAAVSWLMTISQWAGV